VSRDFAWVGLEAAIIELERELPEGWRLERLELVPFRGHEQWRAVAGYRGARISGDLRDTMHAAVQSLRDHVREDYAA
jgi:hypothetical protein